MTDIVQLVLVFDATLTPEEIMRDYLIGDLTIIPFHLRAERVSTDD